MPDSAALHFPSADGKAFPGVCLHLCAVRRDEDAVQVDPSRDPSVRLREGTSYEYRLDSEKFILGPSDLILPSRLPGEQHRGRIDTGIYAGLFSLRLLDAVSGECVAETVVEIRSRKLNYESDYRYMLEDIAERCSELLMELRSPVTQYFKPAETDDAQTLVQRLSFLKAIIGSEDFQNALHRILSMPNTVWREEVRILPAGQSRRMGRREIRQLAKGGRRTEVPETHPLRRQGILTSLPEQIEVRNKKDTVDTAENRFVKHALETFQKTLEEMREKLEKIGDRRNQWIISEIQTLENNLDETLSRGFFHEVGRPEVLPLGSPVLQRKEGYREVLRAWLQFELSARLCWRGGEDVYSAGKRDVATLYEYWVFFRLLEVVSDVFELDCPPSERLIVKTADGFGLKLRAGRHTPLRGQCKTEGRILSLKLSYNRTFARHGDKRSGQYPAKGSWTERMRPDYTLTLWPAAFSEQEAERQELITHVHFDAKYRIEKLREVFGADDGAMKGRELHEELNREAEQEISGTYKRADLLKMHAYRDAIRRTAGAYVLYPGTEAKEWRGFHEVIPGLGAFPLRPMEKGDGTDELKDFLLEVAAHVNNRATQREEQTWQTYRIHKEPTSERVQETLPETEMGSGERSRPAKDIPVLVGYYKDGDHLEWIQSTGLYNFRTGSGPGSLSLGPGVTDARYVLLHGPGELVTGRLYEIESKGPKIYAKKMLKDKKYPGTPTQPYYIVYKLRELEVHHLLRDRKWDIRKLPGWSAHRGSAWPFATTLVLLMQAVVD